MSFQLNVPPSVISRLAKEADDNNGEPEMEAQDTVKKREDWRKLKELEEARKAGTAPAMQDEEGRDINPHIPQYIMQAPWYFGSTVPTLSHQREQEEKMQRFDEGWYKKGVKEGAVATKYRKGACENCGATTHKKKDCLERPRKVGARFTGKDFAPDEYSQPNLQMSYDGKRDRWNGYDSVEHKRIMEEYQKIDEAKRLLKAQRIEELVKSGEIAPEEAKKVVEEDDEEDEDKYAEDVDMPGHKFESKQRITVRNLRIREDTAKYLYNLDVNSAHYDPKTRAMRENPFKQTGKEAEELPYAGDNFVRWSGDAMQMAKQQLFAWEAYEKGSEVNLQADPTKLDMLTQEYAKKKEQYKTTSKDSILDKYGGQEHLDAPPMQLLMGQSEDYVEYSRHGTVLSGKEKASIKSSYDEDVYTNNHTSVWGSYWNDFRWGYACCHSFVAKSYCTGAAGIEAQQNVMVPTQLPGTIEKPPPETLAIEASTTHVTENRLSDTVPPTQTDSEDDSSSSSSSGEERKRKRKEKKRQKKQRRKQKEKEKKKRKRKKKRSSDSDSEESEDEATKRERRILKAIRKEEARQEEVDRLMLTDERKRAYNVTYELKAPDEDDIEAYKRKRMRDEDPMAQFMN